MRDLRIARSGGTTRSKKVQHLSSRRNPTAAHNFEPLDGLAALTKSIVGRKSHRPRPQAPNRTRRKYACIFCFFFFGYRLLCIFGFFVLARTRLPTSFFFFTLYFLPIGALTLPPFGTHRRARTREPVGIY